MTTDLDLKETKYLKLNEELDTKIKQRLESDSCDNLRKFAGKQSESKGEKFFAKPRLNSPDSETECKLPSSIIYANIPELLARNNIKRQTLALKPTEWYRKSNSLPKEIRKPFCLVKQKEESIQAERLLKGGTKENVTQSAESSITKVGYEVRQNEINNENGSVTQNFCLERSLHLQQVCEPFTKPVKTVKPTKVPNHLNCAYPNGAPVSSELFQTPPTVPTALLRKSLSSAGLMKLLKGKVFILQDELNKRETELQKALHEGEVNLECKKKIENQRDQAISKNNNLSDSVTKLENKLSYAERKLKDSEQECLTISREIEVQKREIRLLTQSNANLAKRLYRCNEELETTKANLNTLEENEREVRQQLRLNNEVYEKRTKKLEKQKAELLFAYKKQLFLIDNIKRRNACLEQAKLLVLSEKEFTKILEWNAKNQTNETTVHLK